MQAAPIFAYRWRIAILLCLITTINYIDRQALTMTSPLLKDLFQITESQYGVITSGFLFAYGIGQLLCGPLIDRLGTKRSFTWAVVVWSIATMLHALGRGFLSFFSVRVLLGLAEAANFPLATKAVAEWFPRSERALAVGIFTMGPGLGAIIAPPLIVGTPWTPGVVDIWGWQAAFLIPGAIGFLWLFLWWKWFYLPAEHPSLPEKERAQILPKLQAGGVPEYRPWYWALRYREVWGLMLSRFVSDGAFYFFVFWLPLYFSEARDMNLRDIGFFALLVFGAADVGSIAGGYAGKRFMDLGMSLDKARKLVIWIGAILVLTAMPATLAESPMVAVALISVAMFAIQFKASSMFTLPADLFPANDVGRIWGIYGAVGSLGGAAFGYITGQIIENYSWTPVFIMAACMHIVSAVLINIFVPRIELLGEKTAHG